MEAKENCSRRICTLQTCLPAFSPQPSLPGAIEVGLECLVVWEKPERTFCSYEPDGGGCLYLENALYIGDCLYLEIH